ncbi:MAG: VOC family protein [Eubacteriales bacterium]|nr:VOC family protein [Eubacteriales bacterium]
MATRYVHTNIIAKDWKKLSQFYQKVLHCKPINQNRDLKGEWLDKLTGIPSVHIQGEHLLLPDYSEDHPTLEIFSYSQEEHNSSKKINHLGFSHLAFEVDDVRGTLKEIILEGGGQLGEVVEAAYPDNIKATFVYAKDIEGNIIELQSWQKI